MDNNKTSISIALGPNEIQLVDKYSKKFGISRSAVVRIIINDFFLKNKQREVR